MDTLAVEYTGRIQWWANGVLITETPQKYAFSADMHKLTVYNINFNDTGVYQADLLDAELPQFINFQVDVCKSLINTHYHIMWSKHTPI